MPTNKGALIRRQVLDSCLRSNANYTLLDLMHKCNEVLEEKGFKIISSENTIRTDLFEMEAQFPQAHIVPIRKGRNIFYSYQDKEFSIYKIPLNNNEILGLAQVMSVLKRFDGMPGYEWLDNLINRFKPSINIDTSVNHIVGFDDNPDLKGKEHFTTLLNAVSAKQVLLIRYCGYRSNKEFKAFVHPYYIKQYNNRWFLFGLNEERKMISSFAFDRILEITSILRKFIDNTEIDFQHYFDDMIGVSRNVDDTPQYVELFVADSQLPYILSKPLHHSQRIIDYCEDGAVIRIKVILNFELEQLILSLGDLVKVLSPSAFVEKISSRIDRSANFYK